VTIDGEDVRDLTMPSTANPSRSGAARQPCWPLPTSAIIIETGSAIDIDAYDRATSVPRRVIPRCLKSVQRTVLLNCTTSGCAWFVIIGQCQRRGMPTSSIRRHASQARLTYTEVAAILGTGPEAQQRQAVVLHLLHLHEVYQASAHERSTRCTDFETTETQIVCDEVRIEKIIPRTPQRGAPADRGSRCWQPMSALPISLRSKHTALPCPSMKARPRKKIELLRNHLKAVGIGIRR
jgi:ribonuclease R